MCCANCHCHCHVMVNDVSRSILPLSLSIWYHSNRADLFYPTVLLPFIHCHPLCHFMFLFTTYHNYRQKNLMIFSIFNLFFIIAIHMSILPLPHPIWYQNDRADILYPTVPLPPIHCHSSPLFMFLFTTYHFDRKNHLLIFSIFSHIF
jgi:hypothetical protein